MGKSDKVKELQKTDQNFVAMMDTMEKSLDNAIASHQSHFEKSIQDFYTGDSFKHITVLESGAHRDYQMQMDFTMSNISDVIRMTGEEIFGKSSSSEKTPEQQSIIDPLQPYYDCAVKTATAALSNVLTLLSWSQSAEYMIEEQHVSVGPGMTLHLLLLNKAFQGQTSTDSKTVLQNYIEYKIIFSPELGSAQVNVLYLQSQLTAMNRSLEKSSEFQEKLNAIMFSDEYCEEDIDGPLHKKAANYEICLTDLRNAMMQARAATLALLKDSSADGPLTSCPHAQLKKYLEGKGFVCA